ncbi:MAG: NAD(P)/FAD-dependent oxidoreductase [Deltaproteobacteria bacterium]|nr:NAD(P)/FAD-dependent oxidoreductase [Deltaproteobacteria bacterium]
MDNKEIIIIGAGPAGLAAAHEFIKQGLRPIILEKNDKVGGLARTESYKGFNFDLGGHRFFTKHSKINRLWHEMLGEEFISVPRMSRIYYNGRFFNYPLEIINVFFNLGIPEIIFMLASYVKAQVRPYSFEDTFDQWVSNRFGRRLYETFFKTYTEKVWGIKCTNIKADWASQRIKNLSLMAAVIDAMLGTQKARTLIHEFNYPLKGPGMMWQRFREIIDANDGQILLNTELTGLKHENGPIIYAEYKKGNNIFQLPVEHLISTIPINQFVALLEPKAPEKVISSANSLSYRSFIIVMLIIKKEDLFPDQWIYIHSPDVKVGRIQNFKNWSWAMVPDQGKTSVGMEYFCDEDDETWHLSDNMLAEMASCELSRLGLADKEDVLDSFVVRQPDAYPVYDIEYKNNLNVIKDYLETFDNIQTIGRSGMHRYNNIDHSMLTGILAAQNYAGANHDLWKINEEDEYLEEGEKAEEKVLIEKVLGPSLARLDQFAFATAVGSATGFIVFIATIWLVIKGGPLIGPNLRLLSQYFIGYAVTVKGAFIAFGYSFFWGFLFGWLFAYLRNLFLGLYLFWIKKKTEILSFKDFFDYI